MLTTLFCFIDDFMKEFSLEWKKNLLSSQTTQRGPSCCMSDSEIMTDAPHTQLCTKKRREGKYPQAREFDENGNHSF